MTEKVVAPVSAPVITPVAAQSPTVQITVQNPVQPNQNPIETPKETSPLSGPDTDTIIPKEPYYMDPMFYEVANYFGIKQEEYSAAKLKLSDIVDYIIQEKKSNKTEDIIIGLRELEDAVQPPAWGERRYTNVHRYVRLASKKNAIEQAMGAFKRGGFNG